MIWKWNKKFGRTEIMTGHSSEYTMPDRFYCFAAGPPN